MKDLDTVIAAVGPRARELRRRRGMTLTTLSERTDITVQGAGPTVAVPQRRRRLDPDTGRYRCLSRNQETSTQPTPSGADRVSGHAELKNWRICARSAPTRAGPPSSSPQFKPS